jgi:uncharacterized membrane protein
VSTPTAPLATKTLIARTAAQIGGFGLALLLPAWILWLSPPVNWNPWFLLALATLPLLPALPGLLSGRTYTTAWAGFLALLYFSHGVVEAWAVADVRLLAVTEVTLAVMLWLGGMMYARWRSRELKSAP